VFKRGTRICALSLRIIVYAMVAEVVAQVFFLAMCLAVEFSRVLRCRRSAGRRRRRQSGPYLEVLTQLIGCRSRNVARGLAYGLKNFHIM
jgi:hypothetical protein